MTDIFDRARESIWGTPGFQTRRSTVTAPGTSLMPQAAWIVETAANEEGWAIFLQAIGAEGSTRLVIPDKVAKAIYRHYEAIMSKRRKARAIKGVETRLRKRQEV